MQFIVNDGGRVAAGFKGRTGDCVVRAIAIAAELNYAAVYRDLHELQKAYFCKRTRHGAKDGKASPRNGVCQQVYHGYILGLGFRWTPTMKIGSGCKVHLADGELPGGRIIVRLSGHIAAVIDGVIHDTYDPQRATLICEDGVQRIARRCVYGYFSKGGAS
jgi:hypothetical protein